MAFALHHRHDAIATSGWLCSLLTSLASLLTSENLDLAGQTWRFLVSLLHCCFSENPYTAFFPGVIEMSSRAHPLLVWPRARFTVALPLANPIPRPRRFRERNMGAFLLNSISWD